MDGRPEISWIVCAKIRVVDYNRGRLGASSVTSGVLGWFLLEGAPGIERGIPPFLVNSHEMSINTRNSCRVEKSV